MSWNINKGKLKQLEETLRWIENNRNRLNDNKQTNEQSKENLRKRDTALKLNARERFQHFLKFIWVHKTFWYQSLYVVIHYYYYYYYYYY